MKRKARRLWDLGASWPADPAGLTFCTSEGTLDRKSSTSLLSMLYGFRNFLVNLLIPKTDIHTNISLAVVPGGCALLFPHKQIPAEEMRAVQEIQLAGTTACTTHCFAFTFKAARVAGFDIICSNGILLNSHRSKVRAKANDGDKCLALMKTKTLIHLEEHEDLPHNNTMYRSGIK